MTGPPLLTARSRAMGALGARLLPLLEETGFELVWGFPCQVVVLSLLPVLCSEREGAVLHPVAYDQVPGARGMGQGTETLSKAWRLAG
jgi:hypothetical protein